MDLNNRKMTNHPPVPDQILYINAAKSKYIFSYRKLLHLTNIKIGSTTLEETNNIKFFGIIFDKNIFKNHVDMIAQKISKSIGILLKSSKYLPLAIINTYTILSA